MNILRISNIEELDNLAEPWNALAGDIPFRRHEWLAEWWRAYGAGRELYTLAVVDDAGQYFGILPLFVERSPTQGRVLRLLGTGEVCSDYLGLLCNTQRQAEVALALARWLRHSAADSENRWDALELESLDAHDSATRRLIDELVPRGCLVHHGEGTACWRLELPSTWSDYEALLSKSHRKQVRRLIERVFNTGRAVLHTVGNESELDRARGILIDLHQRRRNRLGQAGCFASPRFLAFHEQVMRRFLAAGMLRLHWLELDGQPAAAEYHVSGGNVIYGYQAGVAPELLSEEPGRLAAIATLRLAIEQRFAAFDFLRGDEPYKAHFRAVPRSMLQCRIAPPRPTARWRHRVWNVQRTLKELVREGGGKANPAGHANQFASIRHSKISEY